jgi:hypothetical protein
MFYNPVTNGGAYFRRDLQQSEKHIEAIDRQRADASTVVHTRQGLDVNCPFLLAAARASVFDIRRSPPSQPNTAHAQYRKRGAAYGWPVAIALFSSFRGQARQTCMFQRSKDLDGNRAPAAINITYPLNLLMCNLPHQDA